MTRKILLLAAGLITVLSFAALPSPIEAQNHHNDLVGVTASPVLDEFTIQPGEVMTRVFKLSNPTNITTTFYPVSLNFSTDNQNGLPTFYTIKEHKSPHSLSDWISFKQESVTIAPDQVAEFAATVHAPANAEPGGHYGAVLFSTEPAKVDTNSNNVSVVGLIGSLLLVTVPGDIIQNVTAEKFDGPTFLVRPPANFSLLFKNAGNIHGLPTGNIKIQSWSGATKALLTVNEGHGNVLPDSQRLFTNSWSFPWWAIGKYTATANLVYGLPEKQFMISRSFLVIPIWLLILTGLVVFLIVWWLIQRKRRGKEIVLTDTAQPLI